MLVYKQHRQVEGEEGGRETFTFDCFVEYQGISILRPQSVQARNQPEDIPLPKAF